MHARVSFARVFKMCPPSGNYAYYQMGRAGPPRQDSEDPRYDSEFGDLIASRGDDSSSA
jgi:hypothetical protein